MGNPLAPKDPHFTESKVRNLLYMYGGPHIDTFDYKPNMKGMDNKTVDVKTFGRGGHRNQGRIVELELKQYECGNGSDFSHVGSCVDDIAFIHHDSRFTYPRFCHVDDE